MLEPSLPAGKIRNRDDEPRAASGSALRFAARIGTAGWSIPAAWREAFVSADDSAQQGDGGMPHDTRAPSHLELYARQFSAVEINSSFYRHHRRATYERWAASVPPEFRFAVKLPRTITHDQSLVAFDAPLDVFLDEIAGLGERLGPLLVQLPPSLQFDRATAEQFFQGVRERYDGAVVCEPRHRTWFDSDAESLLARHRIARVAADPACVPAAALPGGSKDVVYVRLHGSPHMYRSPYSRPFLQRIAEMLRDAQTRTNGGGGEANAEATATLAWCFFDNTTLGAATGDALALQSIMNSAERRSR
jgi:uncharacterized protein YecE (DUF72 family)